MIFDDPVGRCQPQSRAAALVLGGKERIENSKPGGVVHTNAGIGNGHHGVASWFDLVRLAGLRVQILPGYHDKNITALRHRLPGVDKDIQQNLFDLSFVDLHHHRSRVGFGMKPQILAGAAEQFNRRKDQLVDIDRLDIVLAGPGKSQQLQQSNDSVGMGNLFANIGKIYQYQSRYDLAKSNILEGLLIREKINDRYGVARSEAHLGSLFKAMELFDSARIHLAKSVEIAKEIGSPETEAYSGLLLAEIYAALGLYEKAYSTQTRYKSLMDSLSTVTDSKKITQIEMQYEFDKKEREEAIARKNREFWTISIIIFLALVLVVVILLFILQRIRANNEQLQKERFSLANRNLLLEKNALEENLEYKNKELTTNVMYLMKKNELLNDVSKRLLEIKKSSKTEDKAKISKIVVELNSATNDDVWEDFELRFNEVYNEFYERLIGQFPNLTPNDRKLCAFLRLNLSSKEICAITRQTPNSLNVSRARLRKKLGIDNSDTALITFLEKI